MKRFSAREFALLCVPVAVVAGAALWASRRPQSKLYVGPKFSLSYEPPSVLEAFQGAKTGVGVKLGEDSQGNNYLLNVLRRPNCWLDVATTQGTKTWRNDGTGSLKLKGASSSFVSNEGYYLYLTEVPAGDLTFGINGEIVSSSFPTNAKPHTIKQQLSVDKTKLRKFDFSLPRAPDLKIKSATIRRNSANSLDVDIDFVFLGSKDLADVSWQERYKVGGLFYVADWTCEADTMRTHTSEVQLIWTGVTPATLTRGANPTLSSANLTGRVSADNNWPLAFKIEPFDFKTALVGQQLKFKSWPAPLPPGTKN